MVVLNDMDRFHLAGDVIHRVPGLSERAGGAQRTIDARRDEHKRYIAIHGEDMPEIPRWGGHCFLNAGSTTLL